MPTKTPVSLGDLTYLYPRVGSIIYTPGWDHLFIPRVGSSFYTPGWDQVFIPRGGIKYLYPVGGITYLYPGVGSPIRKSENSQSGREDGFEDGVHGRQVTE